MMGGAPNDNKMEIDSKVTRLCKVGVKELEGWEGIDITMSLRCLFVQGAKVRDKTGTSFGIFN